MFEIFITRIVCTSSACRPKYASSLVHQTHQTARQINLFVVNAEENLVYELYSTNGVPHLIYVTDKRNQTC